MRFKYKKWFVDDVKVVDLNEVCYLMTLVEDYTRRYYTSGADEAPLDSMKAVLKKEMKEGRITPKNAQHYIMLSAWFGLQGGVENVTALSTLSCVLEDMLK